MQKMESEEESTNIDSDTTYFENDLEFNLRNLNSNYYQPFALSFIQHEK